MFPCRLPIIWIPAWKDWQDEDIDSRTKAAAGKTVGEGQRIQTGNEPAIELR